MRNSNSKSQTGLNVTGSPSVSARSSISKSPIVTPKKSSVQVSPIQKRSVINHRRSKTPVIATSPESPIPMQVQEITNRCENCKKNEMMYIKGLNDLKIEIKNFSSTIQE